ncbi:MAG: AAA domain-containing protein, partial [Verrucomicrobiota bacterium]
RRTERQLEKQRTRHHHWGQLLAQPPAGLIARLRHWWIGQAISREKKPFWNQLRNHHHQLEGHVGIITRLTNTRYRHRLRSHGGTWDSLKQFRKALGARSSKAQADYFSKIHFPDLFFQFPVWLTNLGDANESLPMEEGLFDLAIIDEATQCDMASCLPLLQRAKRAVIVGDPKQLRHLSFLPRTQQQEFAEAQGLSREETESYDYRETSLLDRAIDSLATPDDLHCLDEHYRSREPIIAFSNRHFYEDQLAVMTSTPGEETGKTLVLHRTEKKRTKSGANPGEADALLATLSEIIQAESALEDAQCTSIGILSPFRAQVDHLARKLGKTHDLRDLERHRIMVGTAHTFQGEERDFMLLSFCVDDESVSASFRFMERPDVFNVAITRARHQQHLFYSLDPARLPVDSLLRKYLSFSAAPGTSDGSTVQAETYSAFAREVCEALETRGFQTQLAFSVAGWIVDIVARKEGKAIGIDLIGGDEVEGSPAMAPGLTTERYRMFHRCGFPIFPLPFANWKYGQGKCLEALESLLTTS